MTDALRTAIEGSLPDDTIEIREARGSFADWRSVEDRALGDRSVPQPKQPKRRTKPGCWSTTDVATVVGVHPRTVQQRWRDCAEFRAAIGVEDVWPLRGVPATKEQVREAGRALLHFLGLTRWAPRTGHDACVKCGKTKYVHRGNGICRRCAHWGRQQYTPYPFPEAWSKKTGEDRCRYCYRSDKPNKAHGLCNSCCTWHYKQGLPSMSLRDQQRAVTKRRRTFKAKGILGKRPILMAMQRDRHE